jgi:hypothetical protein
MPEAPSAKDSPESDGLAAPALTGLAIGCCGLPLILAALVGSVALGTLLGVAAAVLGAVAVVGVIALSVRARRSTELTPPRARHARVPQRRTRRRSPAG